MTDNELLLAIADIMDKKLDARLRPLEGDVRSLKDDMGVLKNDVRVLKSDVASLKDDVRVLKDDVKSIESRVGSLEHDVKLLKLQNENEIIPRLQNIEECYLSTFNRYKDSVDDYESMKIDIGLLKDVTREHSERLQVLT